MWSQAKRSSFFCTQYIVWQCIIYQIQVHCQVLSSKNKFYFEFLKVIKFTCWTCKSRDDKVWLDGYYSTAFAYERSIYKWYLDVPHILPINTKTLLPTNTLLKVAKCERPKVMIMRKWLKLISLVATFYSNTAFLSHWFTTYCLNPRCADRFAIDCPSFSDTAVPVRQSNLIVGVVVQYANIIVITSPYEANS